jgi:hypothetical protein
MGVKMIKKSSKLMLKYNVKNDAKNWPKIGIINLKVIEAICQENLSLSMDQISFIFILSRPNFNVNLFFKNIYYSKLV